MKYIRTKFGIYGVKELEKQLKEELSDKIDSLAYDYEPEYLPSLNDFNIHVSVKNDELVYEVSYSGPSEKYYGHLEIDENLGKVINQSDNAEELFDWVVFKSNGKINRMYVTWDMAVQGEGGNGIFRFDEVYGAIETDKGLTYVAKMDKRGDFQFL